MRLKLKRQRGVAVITALLLTTLAVAIVASLFWQQQVQVRSMENQRLHLQTKWILRGALDWARLVLQQDGLDNSGHTALDAVWNTPLAETRLDQYIERERVEGEVFDASLSGRIVDASSRFNLTNLSNGQVVNPDYMLVYQRLLQHLQINPALAPPTAKFVASGAPPAPLPEGSEEKPVVRTSAPMALTRIEDLLAIPGYTPQIVDKLREFAIVLPSDSTVNVNTAPPEVIAALVPDFSMSEANALVARRKQAYYRDKSQFEGQLYGKKALDKSYDVKSTWFLVFSRVRLDRAALDAEALVKRDFDPAATTETVWVRQN